MVLALLVEGCCGPPRCGYASNYQIREGLVERAGRVSYARLMKFKDRSLREIANMVIGDAPHFKYRSSSYITEFFSDCDLDFVHDGSTRRYWVAERLGELLERPAPSAQSLPSDFARVLRYLMDRGDAQDGDPDREQALASLNVTLRREGFDAFLDEQHVVQFRHTATKTLSEVHSPHRPLSAAEVKRRDQLIAFLDKCSEDDLIEDVLLPLFRHLGFHRITAAGHKDKALEYGKDVWMKFTLPTLHVIYFGLQAKKGKLDSAGMTKGSNANVAEIYQQALMMIGHEVFDPELNRKVLIDHAYIVAGGEITKQARNWIGQKLDATKRAQVIFMDREDIVNLFVVNNVTLPKGPQDAVEEVDWDADVPF